METAATLEQRNEPGLGLEGSGLDLSFLSGLGGGSVRKTS